MRVSTFFADTLPLAMSQVREALGPKAVVLSWRNTRGGVEISASVQAEYVAPPKTQHREPALRPTPHPASHLSLRAQPTVSRGERNDLLANHFSPNDLLDGNLPKGNFLRGNSLPSEATTAPASGAPRPVTRGLAALVNRQSSAVQQHDTKHHASARPETGDSRRLESPLVSSQRAEPRISRPNANMSEWDSPTYSQKASAQTASRLIAFLCRAGLTDAQANMFATSETPELRRALSDSLARALAFAPIEAIPPKPLILVGPPGAGKSTCAAKLAARTIATGHEVLLISADGERCGGADQLAALAKRLGARFEAVTTLADLNELVSEARGRGIVALIDAPSACPAQPADMRATGRMIQETRLEAVLCLPADMRADDLEELASAYQALGVARAIATRLDLTTRRASVLHALKQADIAVAQISATPYISGGVAIATASRLASLLLEPFEDALAEDAA